jgi:hypothetical protein
MATMKTPAEATLSLWGSRTPHKVLTSGTDGPMVADKKPIEDRDRDD